MMLDVLTCRLMRHDPRVDPRAVGIFFVASPKNMIVVKLTTRGGHVVVTLRRRKIIALDCAPFAPRADSCLVYALKNTSLSPCLPVSKVFGEWTFDYSHVDDDEWIDIVPTLAANITHLFNQGRIRYGEWTK